MKKNGACRVRSDLGYLSLSHSWRWGSVWQSQLALLSLRSRGTPTWADPAGRGLTAELSRSSSCVHDLEHGAGPNDLLLLSWKAFPGFENKEEGICSQLRCSNGKVKLKQEICLVFFFYSLLLNTKVQNKLISVSMLELEKSYVTTTAHDYSSDSGIFHVKRGDGRV